MSAANARKNEIRIAALALIVAACGQGELLPGDRSSGWQFHQSRDQPTGFASKSATRMVSIENGHVDLAATCPGERLLFAYDQWGNVEPTGTAKVVEFRLTFIADRRGQHFAIANMEPPLGRQSVVPLRLSTQPGHLDRFVGFADHTNSVRMQMRAVSFYERNGPQELRVEVPLLLQASSAPPQSENAVIDLLLDDPHLREVMTSCDPSATAPPPPITIVISPSTSRTAPTPR